MIYQLAVGSGTSTCTWLSGGFLGWLMTASCHLGPVSWRSGSLGIAAGLAMGQGGWLFLGLLHPGLWGFSFPSSSISWLRKEWRGHHVCVRPVSTQPWCTWVESEELIHLVSDSVLNMNLLGTAQGWGWAQMGLGGGLCGEG